MLEKRFLILNVKNGVTAVDKVIVVLRIVHGCCTELRGCCLSASTDIGVAENLLISKNTFPRILICVKELFKIFSCVCLTGHLEVKFAISE